MEKLIWILIFGVIFFELVRLEIMVKVIKGRKVLRPDDKELVELLGPKYRTKIEPSSTGSLILVGIEVGNEENIIVREYRK